MEQNTPTSRQPYRSVGVLLAYLCIATCEQIYGQSVVSNSPSNAISIDRGLSTNSPKAVTFYDKNAQFVTVDGQKYSCAEAVAKLPDILEGTNSASKVKWLMAFSEFRSDIPSNVVTTLITEFRKQSDPTVRRALLHVIQFSRDLRFSEVMLSARNDNDALIRFRAGALMIEQNNLDGVDVITGCLPELDDRGRQLAARTLETAVASFGIKYDRALGLKKIGSKDKTEASVCIQSWSDWWNQNKGQFLNKR